MIISVLAVIPFTANAEISSVTIGELSGTKYYSGWTKYGKAVKVK